MSYRLPARQRALALAIAAVGLSACAPEDKKSAPAVDLTLATLAPVSRAYVNAMGERFEFDAKAKTYVHSEDVVVENPSEAGPSDPLNGIVKARCTIRETGEATLDIRGRERVLFLARRTRAVVGDILARDIGQGIPWEGGRTGRASTPLKIAAGEAGYAQMSAECLRQLQNNGEDPSPRMPQIDAATMTLQRRAHERKDRIMHDRFYAADASERIEMGAEVSSIIEGLYEGRTGQAWRDRADVAMLFQWDGRLSVMVSSGSRDNGCTRGQAWGRKRVRLLDSEERRRLALSSDELKAPAYALEFGPELEGSVETPACATSEIRRPSSLFIENGSDRTLYVLPTQYTMVIFDPLQPVGTVTLTQGYPSRQQ